MESTQARELDKKLSPLENIHSDCSEGDVLKIYFENGGFTVGIYSGESKRDSDAYIRHVWGEDQNPALLGTTATYPLDVSRSRFIGSLSKDKVIGYETLERARKQENIPKNDEPTAENYRHTQHTQEAYE